LPTLGAFFLVVLFSFFVVFFFGILIGSFHQNPARIGHLNSGRDSRPYLPFFFVPRTFFFPDTVLSVLDLQLFYTAGILIFAPQK